MNNYEMINYFQNRALQLNSLFQVELDITSECNCKCPFCFQGEHKITKEELSLEEIIRLLEDLRSMGVMHIAISGGEPFMRKDAIQIIEEINKRGFLITIITNGMMINDEILYKLAAMKIDRLTFSFHSIDINIYKYLFGIKQDSLFYKSIYNIRKSIELGIPTGIAVTVTKYNIDTLNELKDYFLRFGLQSHDINFNMLLRGKLSVEELYPSVSQIKDHSELLLEKDKLLYGDNKRHLLCTAGKSSCAIDSKGNVYPCTFFNSTIGNIKSELISEIWHSSHLLKIIRSVKEDCFIKCSNCSFKSKCKICLATNLNETNDLFMPSDEYCQSRKARVALYGKN